MIFNFIDFNIRNYYLKKIPIVCVCVYIQCKCVSGGMIVLDMQKLIRYLPQQIC